MTTSKKLGKGFIAGLWGAVILIIVMYVFQWLTGSENRDSWVSTGVSSTMIPLAPRF